MIDYKEQIANLIVERAGEKIGLAADEISDLIEIPTDRSMGDYAFPCFRLAKQLRKAPQIIAAELADDMGDSALIESSIAVNAYVNFMLKRENFIRDTLHEIACDEADYGRSTRGAGKESIG